MLIVIRPPWIGFQWALTAIPIGASYCHQLAHPTATIWRLLLPSPLAHLLGDKESALVSGYARRGVVIMA